MKTIQEIEELVKKAVLAELDGVDFIQEFDDETLRREYNGIGPEWVGEAARRKLTEHLAIFEPAALIHDMRNYKSDGTRYCFNFANFEFWGNCVKLVKTTYPWWTLKHWRARAVARLAFDFVSGPGGWKAWMDSFRKNLDEEALVPGL